LGGARRAEGLQLHTTIRQRYWMFSAKYTYGFLRRSQSLCSHRLLIAYSRRHRAKKVLDEIIRVE